MDQVNIILYVILSPLAVWRFSSLFTREKGPFSVFEQLRKFIYTRTLYNFLRPMFISLNDGLNCMWCNSVWFAGIVAVYPANDFFTWAVYSLAFSALSILIEELYKWLGRKQEQY